MSKGKLFVISGASGVGKGTVLKRCLEQRKDLEFSVSATTRAPRPGETDGKEYYFVTRETFEEMIRNDEFLEHDNHDEHWYGTPKGQLEEKLARGHHVILDIEPNGAKAVRAARADAVLIFIMPPSMEELERRLRGRGDTPEDQIRIRMERAKWEMEQIGWYDYVVTNHQVETCAEEILHIIRDHAERT